MNSGAIGVSTVVGTPPAPAAPNRVDVVAIGASTGGPDALSTVLAALPEGERD